MFYTLITLLIDPRLWKLNRRSFQRPERATKQPLRRRVDLEELKSQEQLWHKYSLVENVFRSKMARTESLPWRPRFLRSETFEQTTTFGCNQLNRNFFFRKVGFAMKLWMDSYLIGIFVVSMVLLAIHLKFSRIHFPILNTMASNKTVIVENARLRMYLFIC